VKITAYQLVSRVVRVDCKGHPLHGLAVQPMGVDDPKLMACGRRFVRGGGAVAPIHISQLVVEETYR
jgi:hypothetical protein